ncbi:DPP IV N-terminal domain-containing protein [bacterium]|nr:DPP IV N-terminal domain-containing protein [bacterium]
MKNRWVICSIAVLLAVSGLFAQTASSIKPNYELAARFSPDKVEKMVFSTSVRPHWLKLSDRFWYTYETPDGKSFYLADPEKGRKEPLFDNIAMAAELTRLTKDPYDAKHLPISRIEFTDDEKAFRFNVTSSQEEEKKEDAEEKKEEKSGGKSDKNSKNKKKVFHFEYTIRTGKLAEIKDYEEPKDTPRWASIAPDSQKVLFSRNDNLYWMDWENYEKALEDEEDSTIIEHKWTDDGEEYYSYGSGGYGSETNVEKEKNRDKRKSVYVVWSRNAEKFALVRSDERKVKDLWVIDNTADPRPTLQSYKYTMPGDKEAPQEELLVFDFPSKEIVKIKAEAFQDQTIGIMRAPRLAKEADDRIGWSYWLSGSPDKLYFSRTSRDLKRIDICVANALSGEVTPLIEERLNTYVELKQIGFVNNGAELIHWSERDGWGHFYLYSGDGVLKHQITSGPYHCRDIEGIDEKNRVLYFSANGRDKDQDPYYNHLYRINFDGSGLEKLTDGNFDHAISVCDDNRFFVDNFSRVDTVPMTVLKNNRGQLISELEKADLSKLMEAGYRFPETFTVKAADGITDLYGVMYKPFDFDPARTYPIIEYVYPGPQTEAVNKSFSARMDRTDRLAQFGFIVVTVGNRGGHPDRSKWYHNYGYGNLRDYGLADKKVTVEQLAMRHPFIDMSKVGIYGHSGGGFMSTAAMLVYPDFFKVAVSSSGNHENNIYNRWWSEKHHGVREVTDDEGNISFEYSIAKNSEVADNLKGRLLITTGDIDNNVHPANTFRLAKALIKANKRFDMFVFPGQRHGYGDMNEYFFWLRADYFCEHLLGDAPDSVDIIEITREIEQKK